MDGNDTVAGIVNSSEIVFYDIDTRVPAGTVYTGEIVSVLAYDNVFHLYYIEYNVNDSQGRKRGYISENAITKCNNSKTLNPVWRRISYMGTQEHYSINKNVYQVPNPNISAFAMLQVGESCNVYSSAIINGLEFYLVSCIDKRPGSSTYGERVTGYILKNVNL